METHQLEVRKFLCIKGIYREPGTRFNIESNFGLNRDWKREGFQG